MCAPMTMLFCDAFSCYQADMIDLDPVGPTQGKVSAFSPAVWYKCFLESYLIIVINKLLRIIRFSSYRNFFKTVSNVQENIS